MHSRTLTLFTALLTLALPARAQSYGEWQGLMARASSQEQNLEFAEAEQTLKLASANADKLGEEEKLLTFSMRGDLATEQGKYEQADELWSAWFKEMPCPMSALALAKTFDAEGKKPEARKLRDEFATETMAHRKEVDLWISHALQPEIYSHWHPLHGFMSNTAVVRFCIYRPGDKTVGFVERSSGDDLADAAALKAMDQSCFHPPVVVKLPVGVSFTFAYHSLVPGTAHRDIKRGDLQRLYKIKKSRLEWQEQHLGSNHPEVAVTLQALAKILFDTGYPREAEAAYCSALDAWEKNKFETEDTYLCYEAFANFLSGQHRRECLNYFQKAARIAQELFPEKSLAVEETTTSLAAARKKFHE